MRFIVLLVLLFSIESHAVKIQFPEDELASESVLPKFDNPDPVKNRNVATAGRFELTGMFGWTLNDVFVDPLTFGAIGTYHINEIHAFQVYGSKLSASVNDYPQQIENETGTPNGTPKIKPSTPESAFLLAYQITPFYGKFSLTKQAVMNMAFYGTAGIGTYNVDGENNFATSAGVGTKIYLTKRFSLRVDYRWFFFNAQDPIGTYNGLDQGKRAQFNSILTAGLGFLF